MSHSKKHIIRIRTLVLFVSLSFIASPLWAIDIVTRKSTETRASGDITEVTKDSIKVKPRTGPEITIPTNDIIKIEWDGQPSEFQLAMTDEQNLRLDKALQGYEKALPKVPTGKSYLKADVEFHIARTWSSMGLSDSSKLDQAIAKVEAFKDANPNSFRYYENLLHLGHLYVAKEDYIKADATFNALSRAPFPETQMQAKIASADVLLKQNNLSGAITAYDQVIALPANDDSTKGRKLEAMIGKATCQIRQDKVDESLKVVVDVIKQAPAANTSLLSKAYLAKGDCLVRQGKNDQALLAYLVVDIVLAPKMAAAERDFHAQALFNLAKLWPTVGQPGRAAEASSALETNYPESSWTKKITGTGG